MRLSRSHNVIAFSLAALLVASPALALAESSASLQKKLDEATAQLNKMSASVAAKGEELNDTKYQIIEVQSEIDTLSSKIRDKEAQVEQGKELVSTRIAADYKSGGVSFMSILLNSDSFNELVNNIYYLSRSNKKDNELMQGFVAMKKELEQDRSKATEKQEALKKLESTQKAQYAEMQKAEAEKKQYVDSLSAEVKAKLEEERKAELERQRKAAEEARKAQQRVQEVAASSSKNNSNSGNAGRDTATVSGSRAAVLAAARSQLGVPYVYGAYSPGSALDCSGFTKYCYSKAGISIPHSAAAQMRMLRPVSRDNLQPGDLIFWIGNANSGSGNHVAIYAGNGMVFHANGTAVVYSPLRGGWRGAGTGF